MIKLIKLTVCVEGYRGIDTESCMICPNGTYADQKNSSECTMCPEHSTSDLPGRDNVTDCGKTIIMSVASIVKYSDKSHLASASAPGF